GPDYTDFPDRPYFLDPSDISTPAPGELLEVPMTIRSCGLYRMAPWVYRVPLLRQAANRVISPALNHLCPTESRLSGMLRAAREARAEAMEHVAFTLHSSELMPGGSPSFRTEDDIERLYDDMEAVFEELSTWCRGMTLKEFHAWFARQ